MSAKQKIPRTISVENALKGVGKSARLNAFRHKRPVAVSIDGKACLIYPDGTQKRLTQKLLRELRNGKA